MPDLEIILNNTYYIECKYVSKMPKNKSSKILSHCFTPTQYKNAYLITKAGGYCVGLIGMKNEAFVIPPSFVKNSNFSYEELLDNKFDMIERKDGAWPVDKLFKIMEKIAKKERAAK